MNILGVGPGELILILIIALVVVGPERLPDLARQGGRLLVQVRNWIQRSPDAAMIMRARAEIEQELAMLRSSLLEVQNVRNEVIEAAKQVNSVVTDDVIAPTREVFTSAGGDLQSLNTDVRAALNGQTVARSSVPGTVAPAPEEVVLPSTDTAAPLVEAELPVDSSAPAVEPQIILPEPVRAEQAHSLAVDLEQLNERMHVMMDEMRALQHELRQRGLIGADWRPTSAEAAGEALEATPVAGLRAAEERA